MEALQAIAARKSVRNYLLRAVEEDKLDALIVAAAGAPKAGEYAISVVLNAGVLRAINDKALLAMQNSGNAFLMERAALPGYQPMYGAPVMLVFSAPEDNPYGLANASNAATSAAIAATALGLGSCYVITPTLALNVDADLSATVGIPPGSKALCCLLAGYAGPDTFAAPGQPMRPVSYCR